MAEDQTKTDSAPSTPATGSVTPEQPKVVRTVVQSLTEEIIAFKTITTVGASFGKTIVKTPTRELWLNVGEVIPEGAETVSYDMVSLAGVNKAGKPYDPSKPVPNNPMFGKYNRKQLDDARFDKIKALGLSNALSI